MVKDTPSRVAAGDVLDLRVTTVTRVEKATATIQGAAEEALGGGEATHAPTPALDLPPPLSPDLHPVTVPWDEIIDMVDAALVRTLVSLPRFLGVESCLVREDDGAHQRVHQLI